MAYVDPLLGSSVIYGSLFGLMCVGLTLTYLTTKVPNFAFANFVVIGIYTSFTLYWLAGFKSDPYLTLPVSFLTGGLAALAMYLLVLKPLSRRGATLVSLMIATFAVDIVAAGLLLVFEDYLQGQYLPLLGPSGFNPYSVNPLGNDYAFFGIPGLVIVAPVLLGGVTIGLYALLTKTKFGIAMRAAIENPSLATVLGINIQVVYMVSWFLAGGIAGLAGTPWVINYGASANTEGELIVTIFAGAVLGGISSLAGGLVGGFLIGGGEIFITTWLSQLVTNLTTGSVGSQVVGFQKAVPLLIMMVTLLFIPQGIVSVDWKNLGKSRKSRLGVLVVDLVFLGLLSLQVKAIGVVASSAGWGAAIVGLTLASVFWVRRRSGKWLYQL
jgi:branched-chain amino acid transport system permease protein